MYCRIAFIVAISFSFLLLTDSLNATVTDASLIRQHKYEELIDRYQLADIERLSVDEKQRLSFAYYRRADTKLAYYKLSLYAFQDLAEKMNSIYLEETGRNLPQFQSVLNSIKLRQLALFNELERISEQLNNTLNADIWLKAYQADATLEDIQDPDSMIAQWFSGRPMGQCSELTASYKTKCQILSSIRNGEKINLKLLENDIKDITPVETRSELVSTFINQQKDSEGQASQNISTEILNHLISYLDMLHTSWVADYYFSMVLNPSESDRMIRVIRNFSLDLDSNKEIPKIIRHGNTCLNSNELSIEVSEWFSGLSIQDKISFAQYLLPCYSRNKVGELYSQTTDDINRIFQNISVNRRLGSLYSPLNTFTSAGLYDEAHTLINMSIQSHQIRNLQSIAGMHIVSYFVLLRYLNRGDTARGDRYRREARMLLDYHEASFNSEYLSLIGLTIQLLTISDIFESYQVTIH